MYNVSSSKFKVLVNEISPEFHFYLLTQKIGCSRALCQLADRFINFLRFPIIPTFVGMMLNLDNQEFSY
jgi:hypothetical protein